MDKQNNEKLKIKEYEEKCTECSGRGWFWTEDDERYSCNNCGGTGKLDWLEKIKGKK